MARVPVLERAFGQDGLARKHRLVGFTSFNLMLAHILTVPWGMPPATCSPSPGDVLEPDRRLPRHAARGRRARLCLVMVVVTSIRPARRRLRYESWHLLHLYAYLGVGLALPHQLWTGQQFLGSTGRTVFWWTAWAAAAAAILVWRVGLPAYRTLRHGLRVTSVVREADGVVSVYLTGAPGRARGRGRTVLHLALPRRPRLVPGPPLLALGRPRRPQPADHREGPRRRQPRRGPPAARHPGARRGPVRPAQRPGPHPAARRPDRRRRRHHPAAGAGRGSGLRAGRGGAGAPVRRPAAVRPRARRPRRGARPAGVACPDTVATRPTSHAPCCTTSPTSPSATSTSAAPSTGPTRSAARPSPPASRPSTSTSRPSRGDPDETHRPLAAQHRLRRGAAVRLPHLDLRAGRHGPGAGRREPGHHQHRDHLRRLRLRSARGPGPPARTGSQAPRSPGRSPRPAGARSRCSSPPSAGTITVGRGGAVPVRQPRGPADQLLRAAAPGPGDPRRPERRHRHGQRRHRHQRGLPPVAAVRARPGRHDAPPPGPAPARYVEHVMGMPISLALRGRHTDDAAARGAWAEAWPRCATSTGCSAPTAPTRSSPGSLAARSPSRTARRRWPRCSRWESWPGCSRTAPSTYAAAGCSTRAAS